MRFWDTSAIVPLLVNEAGSAVALRLLREDEEIAVFWWAEPECVSALARAFRKTEFGQSDVDGSLERLGRLILSWSEFRPTEEIRVRAERLLFSHHLKTSDALQLGAALVWAEDRPRRAGFVSLDRQLRTAARREGFDVLPEKLGIGDAL